MGPIRVVTTTSSSATGVAPGPKVEVTTTAKVSVTFLISTGVDGPSLLHTSLVHVRSSVDPHTPGHGTSGTHPSPTRAVGRQTEEGYRGRITLVTDTRTRRRGPSENPTLPKEEGKVLDDLGRGGPSSRSGGRKGN